MEIQTGYCSTRNDLRRVGTDAFASSESCSTQSLSPECPGFTPFGPFSGNLRIAPPPVLEFMPIRQRQDNGCEEFLAI